MTNDKLHKDRVENLRRIMAGHDVQGFIVPRADEWQGEFVAPYAERLKWLTGFSGSGGAAVVLRDRAMLLTDSRYTLQAAKEVATDIFEIVNVADTSMAKWIADNHAVADVIGYDARLHTPDQLGQLHAEGLALRAVENLVDVLWDDQPAPPSSAVEMFPEHIAGRSAADKCADVARILVEEGLDYYVISLPDSIAWLLNIRAQDTAYIPVALSYLVIDKTGAVLWFIDPARISADMAMFLGDAVELVAPKNMERRLTEIAKGHKIGLDFKHTSDWFNLVLSRAGAVVEELKDPCILPKSCKTPEEQEAIRQAHIIDGVALVKFLAWVDREAGSGALSEVGVAQKLRAFRAENDAFLGSSFPTISGFGPNGAIVHYRAKPETDAKISGDGLLLVDSGAQYPGGTTDITRTVLIGAASQEMRENFTHVLRGHIAVAAAQFERGTLGKDIDALARAPLKAVGLDFAHGTGHGVGCYLAVHEAAANLSPRGEEALQAGMFLSNEPGYYKEGAYGIRIENLVFVQAHKGAALGFETVSLAPIDRRLIVKEMLSEGEIAWLNDYHAKVYSALSGHMDGAPLAWLRTETLPL